MVIFGSILSFYGVIYGRLTDSPLLPNVPFFVIIPSQTSFNGRIDLFFYKFDNKINLSSF